MRKEETASTPTASSTPKTKKPPERTVKTATQPIAQVQNHSLYSIKQAMDKVSQVEEKEDEKETEEHLPDGHFSNNDVLSEWEHFMKRLATEDNVTFNAVRNFELYKSNENEITIKYASESAKLEFQNASLDFLSHFKHKYNNYRLKLAYEKQEKIINLTAGKEESKREIFNKMIEANSLLKDLDDLMKFDFS
ncbi:hypothetical protein [Riemerella columbina]|uniref:hypothetical protein n=1 Tax=Riemerella columbina TaxID=103810 RepID=UPI00266F3A91|nr:hypothetical protein [Riemerella columbina]WKS94703.1 hypothetical protein NYR17_07150 [Riemerella columbina]